MSDFDGKIEQKIEYEELDESNVKNYSHIKNMDLLYDVPVKIKAKLGKTVLSVEEILKLDVDCIIQLDTNVGDLVEIYANDILIGYGEVVVLNENIGIKVVKINVDKVIKTLND